jgi:hypothetical protein
MDLIRYLTQELVRSIKQKQNIRERTTAIALFHLIFLAELPGQHRFGSDGPMREQSDPLPFLPMTQICFGFSDLPATCDQVMDVSRAIVALVQSNVPLCDLLPLRCKEWKTNLESFAKVVTIGTIESSVPWKMALELKDGKKQLDAEGCHCFHVLFLYWVVQNYLDCYEDVYPFKYHLFGKKTISQFTKDLKGD